MRWVSAEHRRQILPEGHRAVLARGLPELRPVRLPTRRGGPPALLQAGKKVMSERLPQVGLGHDILAQSISLLICYVTRSCSTGQMS